PVAIGPLGRIGTPGGFGRHRAASPDDQLYDAIMGGCGITIDLVRPVTEALFLRDRDSKSLVSMPFDRYGASSTRPRDLETPGVHWAERRAVDFEGECRKPLGKVALESLDQVHGGIPSHRVLVLPKSLRPTPSPGPWGPPSVAVHRPCPDGFRGSESASRV